MATTETRHIQNCVDYQTYAITLDTAMDTTQHASLTKRLLQFGVSEPERMGVIYVRGPWGFLVIPGAGYPELRISFYHDTPNDERDAILASLEAAVQQE